MKAEFDQVIQKAQQAEDISNRVKDSMPQCTEEEFPSEAKKLDRIAREVRSVQRAAGQRPSIFLFGASQVGKSYLVHNIAKHPDSGRCEICVGQNEMHSIPSTPRVATKSPRAFQPDFEWVHRPMIPNFLSRPSCSMRLMWLQWQSTVTSTISLLEQTWLRPRQSWILQAKTQLSGEVQMGMDTDALAYFTRQNRASQQSTIATLKRLGYFDVVGGVSHFYPGAPVKRTLILVGRIAILDRICGADVEGTRFAGTSRRGFVAA